MNVNCVFSLLEILNFSAENAFMQQTPITFYGIVLK